MPRRLAAAALLVLLALPARADEVAESSRLFREGDTVQALDRIERHLAQRPRDAKALFLKGLILSEQNKTADAVDVFRRLTEDYPELPEPYNNLAVLYASQGQYDKARDALEMAIRTQPNYATAQENLGDLYARMAGRAYEEALRLDRGNATAQAKLDVLKGIFSRTGKAPSDPSAPAAGTNAPGPGAR